MYECTHSNHGYTKMNNDNLSKMLHIFSGRQTEGQRDRNTQTGDRERQTDREAGRQTDR